MSSFLSGGGGGSAPGSILATGNMTFYVSTTGSDSNDGSLAHPFATIQHATNVAATFNWQGGFEPTIQILNGTYTQNNIMMAALVGLQVNKSGHVLGSLTHSNVLIKDLAFNGIFYGIGDGCIWSFGGLSLDSPFIFFGPSNGASFTLPPGGGGTGLGGIDVTDSTAGNNCTVYHLQYQASMFVFNNTTITGSFGGTYAFLQYSCLFDEDTTTITLPASLPNLQMFFVGNQSTAYFLTTTVVNGAGVGSEAFVLSQGAILTTNNGLATDVPGNQLNSSIDSSSAISQNAVLGAFQQKALQTTSNASGKTEKSINTVTGNYTIDFPDAGNIIQGNSASALNITIPLNATKAFPIGTIIEVAQINSGNVLAVAASGVTLVSIDNTFDVGAINGTSYLEKIATNTWRFSRVLGVPRAGFNRQWWVSTTGSDSNPGTLALPFATITFAMLIAATYDYQNQFNPTVTVESGTYTPGPGFVLLPLLLGGAVGTINGNPTTPSNVVINGRFAGGGPWIVDGFQLNLGDFDTGFNLLPFSAASVDDIILNNTTGISTSCFNISEYSQITFGVTNFFCSIIGNFNHLIFINAYSNTLSGGINFHIGSATFGGRGGAIFAIDSWSAIDASNGNFVFTGSTTGKRYDVETYSVLDGAGSTYQRNTWPGNSKGFVDLTSTLPADIIYAVTAPTSGSTVTATAGQHSVILNPAGALATLTVNLPTDMSDGESYGVSTSQMITALTMATTDGSSIVGPPTTLAAGSGFTMRFDTAANTWYIAALGG